ncbi:MAG: hypothetical protein ABH878_06310 [bacterium]
MGRYFIIIVAGFAILSGIAKLNLQRTGSQAKDIPINKYNSLAAKNITNGVVQLCINQLWQNTNWRTGYQNYAINSAWANANIVDATQDTTLGQDTVRIVVQGNCSNAIYNAQVLVSISSFGGIANVDAGITARCNVATLGNFVVDGRDHDWNGNLIANNGVTAISTTQSFIRGGNSNIGGTEDSGTDITPTKVNYEDVIEENVVWENGYPITPDQVMGGEATGFSEGTLKAIAQSGMCGSQYVTNPSQLVYPLRGVTYLEIPSGSPWLPADFGSEGKGILVVHNSSYDAVVQNLNSGTFHGLIIADDVVHIHNLIIGAVFLLTPGPSEGNSIGNGSGRLLFSREALSRGVQESGAGGTSISIINYWE